MKNLDIYGITSRVHNQNACGEILESLAIGKKIYLLYQAIEGSQLIAVYNCETDNMSTNELTDGFYKNMEYLPFDDMIFLTVENKLVFLDGSLHFAKSIVLDGESNIILAKWNGHQDVLAIFFESSKLSLYLVNIIDEQTSCICATDLHDKPIMHVAVGWGSTHKYKRSEPVQSSYKCDKLDPVIEWKGNLQTFALNYFDGDERVIKVYNSSCELLYTSKGIQSGLEPMVSFKETGNALACITSNDGLDQHLTIIETNCRLLNKIPLETGAKAVKVLWSPCGTCVSVQLTKDDRTWIDLFLIYNSQFNLKQRLLLTENKLVGYNMKRMVPGIFNLELHMYHGVYDYKFVSKFSRSSVTKFDYVFNVNIDGNMLKCYYFICGLSSKNDGAHYIHEHTNPINAVAFSTTNYLIIFSDSESNIFVYDYTQRYNWDLLYTMKLPSEEQIPLSAYRFYMPNDTTLCVVGFSEKSEDILYTYDMRTVEPTCEISNIKKNIVLFSSEKDEHGSNFYSSDFCALPISELFNVRVNNSHHTIYVTVDGALYIDHQRVTEKILSLYVHGDRLSVTTIKDDLDPSSSDSVYGVRLTTRVIQTLKEGGLFVDVSYRRPVEQGSVVLNTIDKCATTILLLPRGNIESIELRNLALSILRDQLIAHEYSEAMTYIKKQSFRLDVLVDLGPSHFFKNCLRMFHALDTCACLNKFFVEIRNEPTINEQEMKLLGIDGRLDDKIVKVASSFEEVYLQLRDANKHLTTYALAIFFTKKDICHTMKKISRVTSNLIFKAEDIVQTVEVLSNHVDRKELYEAALFTFDLPLAELVASKSQMDPCVYRPFIRRVTAMEMFESRFNICSEIGRLKEALFYYLQMYRQESIDDEELIRYATENQLIPDLYRMADVSDEMFDEVAMLYFDILSSAHNYLEAGILANRMQRYPEAVTALLKGGLWQEALTVINNGTMTAAASLTLHREVANNLSEQRNHVEAAHVLIHHCNDYDAAMQCYLNGKEYEFAFRISNRLNNPNVNQMIQENMVLECQSLSTRTQELREKFTQRFERLKVVRQNLKTEAESTPPQDPNNKEFSDVASVTTMASTLSTRSKSSSRSNLSVSRRLKKEQKKYVRLKENSRYEDIALMYNLSELVDEVKDIQKAVNEMYRTIQLRNLDIPDVVTPCELIDELVKYIIKHIPEIWLEEFAAYTPKADDNGIYGNLIHLDQKYRMKPELRVSTKDRATMIFLLRR